MPSNNNISRRIAKQRLATLWAASCAVIIIFMIIITSMDGGTNDNSKFWSWLLPQILPGIGLILSVIFIEANNPPSDSRMNKFYYNSALFISLFYLLAIFIIICLVFAPAHICFSDNCGGFFKSKGSDGTAFSEIRMIDTYDYILGSFSGFVTGALGMFFIKKVEA